MRYKHQCLEIRFFQIEAEWLNVNVTSSVCSSTCWVTAAEGL